MPSKSIILLFAVALLSPPLLAQASFSDEREEFAADVKNSDIGAGYAQMLNFFVDPSISASRLDSDDGVRYDILKLPLQYVFPAAEGDWQFALRATLSHAQAEEQFSIVADEVIDGVWKADSALLGVGARKPIGERWSWFAAAQYGISRLENEADYNGLVSEVILAPLLDGVLFNWDTNARISSVTAGVDYSTRLRQRYDLNVTSRYTYSHISSYSESRDLQSFREETGTLTVSADLQHPWGVALGNVPLFGVVHLGALAFTGSNRNALGFNHFYNLGYSIGIDVAERNRFFNAFTVGAQANLGREVDGFSVIFGWRLK